MLKWSDKPPKRPLWAKDEPLTPRQKLRMFGRLCWGFALALFIVLAVWMLFWLVKEVATSWIWEWLRCL